MRPLLGILITSVRFTHLRVYKNMRYECVLSPGIQTMLKFLKPPICHLSKKGASSLACHLYKIVNSLTDFPAAPVFPPDHFHKTRSSDKPTFIVPKFRTSAYQYSFFPNTLSLWNDLPRDIFVHSSFNSFKRSVLLYL